MDIIKKQSKKKSRYTPTDTWTGAYSDQTTNNINESFSQSTTPDEYLEKRKDTTNYIATNTSDNNNSSNTTNKTLFWLSVIIFVLAILFAIGFFIYRTNNTINKISDGTQQHSFVKTIANMANPQSYKTLNGFDSGRINILLLGRANTHKSGKNLTDTIMIASINTDDYTLGLLSLPRDLLVSNDNFYVKINSRYQTGLRTNKDAKYIIDSVENVTGQNIHYYFVLDFEGFTQIINTLGGININVPRHIKDERYPGPGYSYETFEVWPGLQEFDGTKALKYARTRHDDIEGDFGRAKRQQQVMQSARNKAFSLGTIVNPIKINELLTILGEHVHTNIEPNEIEPFISLIKKVDTQNITNVVVDAWKPGSLLISARYYNEHGGISGLVPRIGNYKEIKERAENIFTLNKLQQRKTEIEKESPTILLLNTTNNKNISNHIKKTLLSLGFKKINMSNKPITEQDTTTIVDNTSGNKPFSLDELIKKIPATLKTKPTTPLQQNAETDFVILLGNDIVKTYTYQEISRQELEEENSKSTDN